MPSASRDAPDCLNGPALAKWAELAPRLAKAGILTELDRDCLAGYCMAYGTLIDADEKLQRTGILMKGYRGQMLRRRSCASETKRWS